MAWPVRASIPASSSAAPANAIAISEVTTPATASGTHQISRRCRLGAGRGRPVTGPVARAVISRSVALALPGSTRAAVCGSC